MQFPILISLTATFVAQFLVLAALLPSRPVPVALSVAIIVALALGLAIIIAHVPLVVALRRVTPRLRPFTVGFACAMLFPLSQLAVWLMFRDSTETLATLVYWYIRLPGEALATGGPLALGGFVFGTLSFGSHSAHSAPN